MTAVTCFECGKPDAIYWDGGRDLCEDHYQETKKPPPEPDGSDGVDGSDGSDTPLPNTLEGYLDALVAFMGRFLAIGEAEKSAVALWVAHSFVLDCLDQSPILHISSPEKRSGKSRLMDCIRAFVGHHEYLITPTESVVFSLLAEAPRPILLLDEVDAIFGRKNADQYQGLRALLNAGNRRGSHVPRMDMEHGRKVVRFPVFGAKALAGIGELPDTIADRSVAIHMRRRLPSEKVERWREGRHPKEGADIPRPDWEMVGKRVRELIDSEAVEPIPALNDRANDSWEPLRAVGLAASPAWGLKAAATALSLSSDSAYEATTGGNLLADVWQVFSDAGEDYLLATEVLRGLLTMDDSPWLEAGPMGNPLTTNGLSRLLRPYGIKSKHTDKGSVYLAMHFRDAVDRYGAGSESSHSGTASHPSEPSEASDEESNEHPDEASDEAWDEVADGSASAGTNPSEPSDPSQPSEPSAEQPSLWAESTTTSGWSIGPGTVQPRSAHLCQGCGRGSHPLQTCSQVAVEATA